MTTLHTMPTQNSALLQSIQAPMKARKVSRNIQKNA